MSWWVIVGMSIITYVNRYTFFARVVSYQPGAKLQRFLSYSSYAILTSIWAPILFQTDYQSGLTHAGLDYLLAASVAAVLSIMRVHSLAVVVLSTAVFFGLRFLSSF